MSIFNLPVDCAECGEQTYQPWVETGYREDEFFSRYLCWGCATKDLDTHRPGPDK